MTLNHSFNQNNLFNQGSRQTFFKAFSNYRFSGNFKKFSNKGANKEEFSFGTPIPGVFIGGQ